jgi:hypothetical protein
MFRIIIGVVLLTLMDAHAEEMISRHGAAHGWTPEKAIDAAEAGRACGPYGCVIDGTLRTPIALPEAEDTARSERIAHPFNGTPGHGVSPYTGHGH